MSKLQAKIEEVATRFAETIVETIRGLTIDELTGFMGAARGALLGQEKKPAAAAPQKAKAPRVESAKQRAARKIQGSYIGLLRKFTPKEKLLYKRIAKDKGVPEAIVAMKKKLGRV
ncbi:MAG: hypothetical protein GYA57_22165 [Myxococcales bacterium]|nr:hypothetical protein [Myxococcales bacterium]